MRRRDRLRGHPQEGQHSAVTSLGDGTRDRMPPGEEHNIARGIVTRRAETRCGSESEASRARSVRTRAYYFLILCFRRQHLMYFIMLPHGHR
jgi:hypothetical protein